MPEFPLLNVASYVAGHDFTGDTNQGQLMADAAALDATTFRSNGWSEVGFGLKSATYNLQGLWQSAVSDAVDPDTWANLGGIDLVHTVAMAEAEGNPAYMFQAGENNYQPFSGGVGQLAGFTLNAVGSNGQGVIRGRLAKAKGAANAVGPIGTGQNLGLVGAGQYLYATFHVFTAATTITVQVQSDDNSGFTTPTVRGTIGPLTVRGGTWMARVAGPIATDTWWRFNVSAITGAFVVAGAIGIGS